MHTIRKRSIRGTVACLLLLFLAALFSWLRNLKSSSSRLETNLSDGSGQIVVANTSTPSRGVPVSWHEDAKKLFLEGYSARQVLDLLNERLGFRLISTNLRQFLELALGFGVDNCIGILRENAQLVDFSDTDWNALLRRIAGAIRGPEDSIEFALEFLKGENQAAFLTDRLEHLPKTNLKAALASFELLPSGDAKEFVAGRIAEQLAVQAPKKMAVEWLEQLSPPELQFTALRNYIGGTTGNLIYDATRRLTEEQFDALQEAFNHATQKAVVECLGSEIVRAVAGSAPDQIRNLVEWIGDQPPERGDSLRLSLARQIVATDKALALELVSALEDPQQQSDGVAAITANLVAESPEKALQWAAAIPDAELSRLSVDLAVLRWATNDPASARDWAQQIPSAAERENRLVQIAETAATKEAGKPVAREILALLSEPAHRERVSRAIGD